MTGDESFADAPSSSTPTPSGKSSTIDSPRSNVVKPLTLELETTSEKESDFVDLEFLCRFLEVSNVKHVNALSDFLAFMGSETVVDLIHVQEEDFEKYENSLSPTLKRKLLLVASLLQGGGSLHDISSVTELATKPAPTPAPAKSASTTTGGAHEYIVELDVGGYKFTTTKETLCRVPGSPLEAMFSGRHPNPACRKPDGSCVIDRNGMHFHHILDFLRVGTVVSLPSSVTSREELVVEADFYGLEALAKAIRMPQVDTTEHVSQAVLAMWQDEEVMRKAFMNGAAKGFDLHRGLVPFFCPDNGVNPLPLRYKPIESNSDLLMDNLRKNPSPGTPVTVTTLGEFESNLNREHPNMLHSLSDILLQEKVIIAGGAVLRALTSSPGIRTADWWGDKSDVDLFLYCDSVDEATRVASRIFFALADDNERLIVMRSRGVITMHNYIDPNWNPTTIGLKVQIVLRLYDSPAEVLLGFDCDCCCCAYDGRSVWITPRCQEALQTGVNILNPIHAWPNKPSYELRLAKYSYRGFSVLVPGLERTRILYDSIRRTNLRELKGMARLFKIAFEMDASPDEMTSWNRTDPPRSKDFPQLPLKVRSLVNHERNVLNDVDLLCGGLFARGGYDYDDAEWGIIIPGVFGFDGREPMHSWDWALPGSSISDIIPLARDCAGEAWNDIFNAGGDAPDGIPACLVDSWDTEKRSREYLNSDMDKYDLDSVYYGHAYES